MSEARERAPQLFRIHAAEIKEIAVGRAGSPLHAESVAPTGEWSPYLKICG